jgi:phage shock protein A
MGIFDRITDLMKANVNDMITKAEDPEKMINQMIFDMEEQMNLAKGEVSKAIAEEKKLLKYYQDEKGRVEHWLSKAELAVKNGDDSLAMEALGRKNKHEEICAQYQAQYEEQKESSNALKTSLASLQTKIEDAKRQKSVLIARSKRAEAQNKVNTAMNELNKEDSFSKFQRMAERIEEKEFINQANSELYALSEDSQLEKKFDELEEKSSVMDELEALKSKLKE